VSTFEATIDVGDFAGNRWETVNALVDTGATYTAIPSDVLSRLGVEAEKYRPFFLANGQRVEYGLAWIRVRLDGRQQPSLVIFAEPGTKPLLGAFTLEGFGLAADPVNRRLVPAVGYMVGIETY